MTSPGDKPQSRAEAARAALANLRQAFLRDLPATWNELRSAVHASAAAEDDVGLREQAVQHAHNLHGAAGSLSLNELSETAAMIELGLESVYGAAKQDRPGLWTEIERLLADGDSCVAKVCSGCPPETD